VEVLLQTYIHMLQLENLEDGIGKKADHVTINNLLTPVQISPYSNLKNQAVIGRQSKRYNNKSIYRKQVHFSIRRVCEPNIIEKKSIKIVLNI
jgi:hypothetical protein